MAHRDDTGAGPGANDNASGTAALIELARAYAQPLSDGSAPVSSGRQDRLPLNRRRGLRRARGGSLPEDLAVAQAHRRRDQPRCDRRAGEAGDRARRRHATLAEREPRRHGGRPRRRADGRGAGARQLLRTATRSGLPVHASTSRARSSPTAFPQSRSRREVTGRLRRSATMPPGSTRSGSVSSAPPPSSFWARSIRDWSSRRAPGATCGSAGGSSEVGRSSCFSSRCSSHTPSASSTSTPAAVGCGSRCGRPGARSAAASCSGSSWASPSRAFVSWGHGRPAPHGRRIRRTAVADDWPVPTLVLLCVLLVLGWVLTRARLAVRRPVTPEEELAGYTVALLELLVVALLIAATNPFALIFALPALNVWLWLPQIRIARPPVRLALFARRPGRAGAARLLARVALRDRARRSLVPARARRDSATSRRPASRSPWPGPPAPASSRLPRPGGMRPIRTRASAGRAGRSAKPSARWCSRAGRRRRTSRFAAAGLYRLR